MNPWNAPMSTPTEHPGLRTIRQYMGRYFVFWYFAFKALECLLWVCTVGQLAFAFKLIEYWPVPLGWAAVTIYLAIFLTMRARARRLFEAYKQDPSILEGHA